MLQHRSRPRRDVAGADVGRLSSDTLSSTSTAANSSTAAVYAYGARPTVTTSHGERTQPRLVSLSKPLLHAKHSRSMSAVPTKRSLSAGVHEQVHPNMLDIAMTSTTTTTTGFGSRKATRLFAALRRSNSSDPKRSGKGVSGRGMFSTAEERSASSSSASSRTASPARTIQPPSITQIAMGLHTSRTPHLGPSPGFLLMSDPGIRTGSAVHLHAYAHSRGGRGSVSPPPSRPQTASSSTRVATPLRSSLKKEKTDADLDASRSASPSVSASSVPVPSTSRTSSALSRLSLAISKNKNSNSSVSSGVGQGEGLSPNSGRSRLDKFLGRGLGRSKVVKSSIGSIASLNSTSSDGDSAAPRKAVRFVSSAGGENETVRAGSGIVGSTVLDSGTAP